MDKDFCTGRVRSNRFLVGALEIIFFKIAPSAVTTKRKPAIAFERFCCSLARGRRANCQRGREFASSANESDQLPSSHHLVQSLRQLRIVVRHRVDVYPERPGASSWGSRVDRDCTSVPRKNARIISATRSGLHKTPHAKVVIPRNSRRRAHHHSAISITPILVPPSSSHRCVLLHARTPVRQALRFFSELSCNSNAQPGSLVFDSSQFLYYRRLSRTRSLPFSNAEGRRSKTP